MQKRLFTFSFCRFFVFNVFSVISERFYSRNVGINVTESSFLVASGVVCYVALSSIHTFEMDVQSPQCSMVKSKNNGSRDTNKVCRKMNVVILTVRQSFFSHAWDFMSVL